jgi:glucose-6-phosphate isomerase
MQLPDEALTYDFQGLLVPASEEWTPAAELRQHHFLSPARLKEIQPRLLQIRSQVIAERDMGPVAPDQPPFQAGFIDLPQMLLDAHRRQGEASELGRILQQAARLRNQVDRVLIVGVGGVSLGARALFEALCSLYHNELPAEKRLGTPRFTFEGDHFDNDAFQELLDLLQTSCVDPEIREERWGAIVCSKSGETLETAVAFRLLHREAAQYYGSRSERLRQVFRAVTGAGSKLHELFKAQGCGESDVFLFPENVGGRFSVFTAASLLPAAVMGLDVRALLLGAGAMTRVFLDEPFERNPVLQYAAVNFLMAQEFGKPIRVLSAWSKKLHGVGLWYDQLLADSLGKRGQGPTPLTVVPTRDWHARGQQLLEGPRDKIVNNLVVRTPRQAPVRIGMADHNQDGLNSLNRTGYSDLTQAALEYTNRLFREAARPTANLVMPMLSEHTMGQLLQMLQLAAVVEGRLMGINPYGQPAVEVYKKSMREFRKE